MSKITITLPDKSTRTYQSGVTPLEVAESIGSKLAKDTVAASINGELSDATIPLTTDSDLNLYTGSTSEGHEVLLHSTAHLMAQAVKTLWPERQITIGPAINNRFYYDFDIDGTFSNEDLQKIEDKMQQISKENLQVTRKELSRNEAIKVFKDRGEKYKVEIIQQIDKTDKISAYTQGDFIDLCRGPHVPSTGK